MKELSPEHCRSAYQSGPRELETEVIEIMIPALRTEKSYKRVHSVEVGGCEELSGETKPRRNSKLGLSSKLRSSPNERIKTVYDLVEWAAENHGDKTAISVKSHHFESFGLKTDEFHRSQGSDLVDLSYQQYLDIVHEFGSGLHELGMVKGDRILIQASTGPHWLAISHGASSQSVAFVTAYESLGLNGIIASLRRTKPKAVLVDRHLFPIMMNVLKSEETPSVQAVIYNSQTSETPRGQDEVRAKWNADLYAAQESLPQIKFLSVTDLRELGRNNLRVLNRPSSEDLAAIYYTSGSTGNPKGVPIKQKAIIASVAGLDSVIGGYLGSEDLFLAYLPLAHVLEYAFENSCFFWGTTIGYGSPRTLFDNGASTVSVKGDFSTFRPTFLIGVPAIWERIKKAILSDVNAQNMLRRSIFWAAVRLKSTWSDCGLPGAEYIVAPAFKEARRMVGSRLKFAMSGGGPIAETTQHLLSMILAPIVNGYGLTETMAMGGLMDPSEWQTGSLGSVPASIEMKLVDFPEAGYFVSNVPPQGEVLLRGDSVFEGYFDETGGSNDTLTPEGWFCTGDIGQLEPNGSFRLIDRKKNLIKTLNGEYIALEKLESIYRAAPLVSNICVHASPLKSRPMAFVIPSLSELKTIASQCGINVGTDAKALLQNKTLINAALDQLQAVAMSAGLTKIEVIEQLVLVEDDEWNPGNGLTTAVGKLNRRAILQRYENLSGQTVSIR